MRQQNLLNHFPQQKKSATPKSGPLELSNSLASQKQKQANKLSPSFQVNLTTEANDKAEERLKSQSGLEKLNNRETISPNKNDRTQPTADSIKKRVVAP